MEPAIDIPARAETWALANEYPASSLPGEGDGVTIDTRISAALRERLRAAAGER